MVPCTTSLTSDFCSISFRYFTIYHRIQVYLDWLFADDLSNFSENGPRSKPYFSSQWTHLLYLYIYTCIYLKSPFSHGADIYKRVLYEKGFKKLRSVKKSHQLSGNSDFFGKSVLRIFGIERQLSKSGRNYLKGIKLLWHYCKREAKNVSKDFQI